MPLINSLDKKVEGGGLVLPDDKERTKAIVKRRRVQILQPVRVRHQLKKSLAIT